MLQEDLQPLWRGTPRPERVSKQIVMEILLSLLCFPAKPEDSILLMSDRFLLLDPSQGSCCPSPPLDHTQRSFLPKMSSSDHGCDCQHCC